MLPIVVASRRQSGCAVPAVRVVEVLSVAVVDESVVAVDGDVIVATPSASPTGTPTPEGSHRNPNTERYGHARRIIARRRICDRRIRINWSTVDYGWVVARDVNNLWTGLFDDDNLLTLDDLGFHFLLFGGFQIPCILSFLAHSLHGVHDVALLRKKSIPEICCPLDVVS
jgi:hypothetical protein